MEQDPPLTNSNTKNPKVYQKKGQEVFVKSILTNTKYKKKRYVVEIKVPLFAQIGLK